MVELSRMSGQDREVAGADEQDVHPLDVGDRLDLIERPGVFDLDRQEGLVVGLLDVRGDGRHAVRIVAVAAVQAPAVERGELRPSHQFAGLVDVAAARIHDTVGPGFEQAVHPHELPLDASGHQIGRADPGGAHQRRGGLDALAVMFQIEPDAIEVIRLVNSDKDASAGASAVTNTGSFWFNFALILLGRMGRQIFFGETDGRPPKFNTIHRF